MKLHSIKSISLFLLGVLMVTTLTQCKKEDEQPITEHEHEAAHEHGPGNWKLMELGKKRNDIYTVKSMKEALNSLHNKGKCSNHFADEIKATHLYVRFLPKDGKELETLSRIKGIYLYEYPLDVEITNDGNYYHDPSLPEGGITWQYTVVPIDFEFPELRYEKLKEIVLMSEGIKSPQIDQFEQNEFNQLEDESLRIHGYPDEVSFDENGFNLNTSFAAHGFIKTYDDKKNEDVPVVGVKVRARRNYITREDDTNDDGYYYIKDYGGKVTYSIKWENAQYFDIRDGNYGQFYTNGPKQQSGWSITFKEYHYDWDFTHAFRAGYEYFHEHDDWGINRPPYNNGILNQRLHIGVKEDVDPSSVGSHYFDWNSFLQSAQIIIHSKGSEADRIFATTIHEMAHASHWEAENQNIEWLTYDGKVLIESWAEGVEDYVYDLYYEKSDENWSGQDYVPEFEDPLIGDPKLKDVYTPVIQDLIDDYNQSCRGWSYQMSCPYGGTKKNIGETSDLYKTCWVCEVGTPPSGTTATYWPDHHGWFFHNPMPGNVCLPGDPLWGGNCMFQDIHPDSYGWVENNNYYVDAVTTTGRMVDHVSGFTLGELEDIVHQCNNMTEFKQKLNETDNPTVEYIDELFAQYGF